MSFNLHVGRLQEPQRTNSSQVRNLSNDANKDDESIFAGSESEETIGIGYGFENDRTVRDRGEAPTRTVAPNVGVANINANPTDEELEDVQKSEDTFEDFYSMVHDTYGHELEPNEFLQIMHAIVTAPENAEIFKDFIESDEFEKFESACLNGEEASLGYVSGLLDGATEDLQGITLPEVDIY